METNYIKPKKTFIKGINHKREENICWLNMLIHHFNTFRIFFISKMISDN